MKLKIVWSEIASKRKKNSSIAVTILLVINPPCVESGKAFGYFMLLFARQFEKRENEIKTNTKSVFQMSRSILFVECFKKSFVSVISPHEANLNDNEKSLNCPK